MKFYRIKDKTDLCLGGVCAGIAYYFGIKTWIVRVAFITLVFLTYGPVVLAIYSLLASFLPKYKYIPPDYERVCQIH